MADAERPDCSTCSMPGTHGLQGRTPGIPVKLGDGNCVSCQQVATPPPPAPTTVDGSKDGQGAADNDKPFAFGQRINSTSPFPFTTHQFVRLMILRSRLLIDGLLSADDRYSGEES